LTLRIQKVTGKYNFIRQKHILRKTERYFKKPNHAFSKNKYFCTTFQKLMISYNLVFTITKDEVEIARNKYF